MSDRSPDTSVRGAAQGVTWLNRTVGMVWTLVSPTFTFALAAGFMLAGTLAIFRGRD